MWCGVGYSDSMKNISELVQIQTEKAGLRLDVPCVEDFAVSAKRKLPQSTPYLLLTSTPTWCQATRNAMRQYSKHELIGNRS